jgi:hypothetical protein
MLRRVDTAILLATIAVEIAVVTLVMRCVSLPRALRILGGRGGRARRSREPERVIAAIDRVFRIDRFVWKASCWKRSLVLHRHLRRGGVNSRIVWAFREDGHSAGGHAWVEVDGHPIGERQPTDGYSVMLTYP